jgi:hypothetical protein
MLKNYDQRVRQRLVPQKSLAKHRHPKAPKPPRRQRSEELDIYRRDRRGNDQKETILGAADLNGPLLLPLLLQRVHPQRYFTMILIRTLGTR